MGGATSSGSFKGSYGGTKGGRNFNSVNAGGLTYAGSAGNTFFGGMSGPSPAPLPNSKQFKVSTVRR